MVDDERVPAEDGGEEVPRRDPVVVHVQEGKNLHCGSQRDWGERRRKERDGDEPSVGLNRRRLLLKDCPFLIFFPSIRGKR
jgi:hypothetical protein